jgi:hypothetical protein
MNDKAAIHHRADVSLRCACITITSVASTTDEGVTRRAGHIDDADENSLSRAKKFNFKKWRQPYN